jgi:hypothetical protein
MILSEKQSVVLLQNNFYTNILTVLTLIGKLSIILIRPVTIESTLYAKLCNIIESRK